MRLTELTELSDCSSVQFVCDGVRSCLKALGSVREHLIKSEVSADMSGEGVITLSTKHYYCETKNRNEERLGYSWEGDGFNLQAHSGHVRLKSSFSYSREHFLKLS